MNKINKILITLTMASSYSIVLADSQQVYSWRSENGNVVFSEEKPADNVDYKTINVGKPTVVDTKASKKSTKDIEIGQSDIEKLANSKLAENNKQELDSAQSQILEVTITSPSETENKFSKEEQIPITTDPAITADDHPEFLVNGSKVPGNFQNGSWTIPRPEPGQNKITVAGTTAGGQQIKSTNEATLGIFNGTIQQMKNTGNYRRAAAN